MAGTAEKVARASLAVALLFSLQVNGAQGFCCMHHRNAYAGQAPLSKSADGLLSRNAAQLQVCAPLDSPFPDQCKCNHSCDSAAGSCTHVTVGLINKVGQPKKERPIFASSVAARFTSVILPASTHPPSLIVA